MPKLYLKWVTITEKTLESPLNFKEIKPVNPKGNQPWIFIGRTDAKTDVPVLWPPDMKSQLISKDPGAGKDWGLRRRGWQRMRYGVINSMEMSLSKLWETVTGKPEVLQFMGSQRFGHPYGRKWRGTKKPLDENERGEWKSWPKAQHSENEDHGKPVPSLHGK